MRSETGTALTLKVGDSFVLIVEILCGEETKETVIKLKFAREVTERGIL